VSIDSTNSMNISESATAQLSDIQAPLQVDQKTLDDYYAFFTGKEVDMLPYVYAEPSEAYSELVKNNPDYYLFRDEVNTIAFNEDSFKKYLSDVTDIIEIGPGCDYTVKHKTAPILDYTISLQRYYAIDYSECYLRDACIAVQRFAEADVDVLGIKADIMNGTIELPDTPHGKKCVLFLGSTLGNFTNTQQSHAINHIALITNPGDVLVITADTNMDEKKVLKAYDNAYDDMLISGIFKHFARIYPEFLQYIHYFQLKYSWDKSEKTVSAYFLATHDLHLNFRDGRIAQITKNQKFYAARSRKFDIQYISSLLENKFDISKTLAYSGKTKTFICKRI